MSTFSTPISGKKNNISGIFFNRQMNFHYMIVIFTTNHTPCRGNTRRPLFAGPTDGVEYALGDFLPEILVDHLMTLRVKHIKNIY